MTKCKWCGNKGLFKVNLHRLCDSCNQQIFADMSQRAKILDNCAKVLQTSKNIKTMTSRLDLLIEQAEAVSHYEEKGIMLLDLKASEIIEIYTTVYDENILTIIEGEINKGIAKAKIASTSKTSINQYNKLLLKINDYKGYIKRQENVKKLDRIGVELQTFVHSVKLDAYLESAKNAEFKGNKEKALNQYLEALYFLRNDDIDYPMQTKKVKEIKDKVKQLNA